MNDLLADRGSDEFDVQGFVSQSGYALGECLDATGIDWRIDARESRSD